MKVVLITGGSSGLGKSMAMHLAQKGHDIAITYKSSKAEADSVISEIEKMGQKAVALQLDVSNSKSFSAFADSFKSALCEKWGKESFDALISNAGMGINAMVCDITEEQFDELMNTHFKGVFFLTQKLLPILSDGGKIINISSGLTRFSLPGYSVYAAMKGAIEVLTRYMAKELGSRKITVNTIAPGAIETDFGGGVVRDNKDVNAFVASQTALGRVGLPDDIGAAVSAIVSDDASWINGQRIEVSGGMFL